MSRRWVFAGPLAAVLIGTAAWLAHRAATRPFAAIEIAPGLLVGDQPRAGEWPVIIGRYGLRSVVNLRGARPAERWYVDELAACRDLKVGHEDVRIKLDDWPPQHEVRRFVDVIEGVARPVLLHCKRGVDRSGWGAAVATALAGAPLEQALGYLSPAFGHICNPGTCPLHRFFARYRAWLEASGTAHTGAAFRRWALEIYCPPPYDAEITVLTRPLPRRVAPGEPIALLVSVANRSDEPWTMTPLPDRGIRLGARLLGPFAAPPDDPLATFRTPNNPARDVARAGLVESTVPPGGERELSLSFAAPQETGAYAVQVDMVDEHVHWFSDLGGPGVIFRMAVQR